MNIASSTRWKRRSTQPKAERSDALGVNGTWVMRAVSAKVLSIPIIAPYFCAYSATTTDTDNTPTASFRYATFCRRLCTFALTVRDYQENRNNFSCKKAFAEWLPPKFYCEIIPWVRYNRGKMKNESPTRPPQGEENKTWAALIMLWDKWLMMSW